MVRDGGLGRAILIALVLCGQACQHTTVSGVPDEALVGLATLEAATSIQLSTTLGQPDDCVSSAVRIGEVLATSAGSRQKKRETVGRASCRQMERLNHVRLRGGVGFPLKSGGVSS